MVAGEDEGVIPWVVLRAPQRLFRLGSEHGQARPGLCLGTQARPISAVDRHSSTFRTVTYVLISEVRTDLEIFNYSMGQA